jgi:hypothetical protein
LAHLRALRAATAVFEDQKLTRLKEGDPRTRLWALLYAQVAQADGRMRRNVLIGRAPARPRIEMNALGEFQAASTRDLIGVAEFDPIDVELMLAQLALPPETPLSVIVVELLPGDHLTQTEFSFGSSDLFPFEVGKAYFLSDRAEGTDVVAGGRQVIGISADPLGRELGTMTSRRILRCSPLTSIAAAC